MSDDTITTPCCADELVMPPEWRGASAMGVMVMRLHLDQCQRASEMAYVLVAETEAYLKRRAGMCGSIVVLGGNIMSCIRTDCDGRHYYARPS